MYRVGRPEAALGTKARVATTSTRALSPSAATRRTRRCRRAYYNKLAGITRLTTETGARHGALRWRSRASVFGLTCDVWQVRNSYETKPYRRMQMETYGATATPSPSTRTETGRAMRERFPRYPRFAGHGHRSGRGAAKDPHANYSLAAC